MKTFFLLLLLAVVAAPVPTVAADGAPAGAPADSAPHERAIRLVMQARADELRALEALESPWFDTKERTWSVKRPFGPGIVDSRNYLVVTYAIDGVVVGEWNVNPTRGIVTPKGEPFSIEGDQPATP